MNKYSAYIFLCFLNMAPQSTYAWGAFGHQLVCDIAWQESSSSVKTHIQAAAKRMGYKTFAQSCVWADSIKRDATFDRLKPLHYINVSRAQNSVQKSSCLSHKTPQCVVTAIDEYAAQAVNDDLPQLIRDQALLLLGHFVADVHQPLHVSYREDRGGTGRHVTFEGKVLSLHYVWDTALLYCQKGQSRSWRKLGRQLHQESIDMRIGGLSAVLWANESLAITQQVYANLSANRLPRTYCAQYSPIVKQRLQLAGRRLATLLAQMLVP